MDSFIPVGLAGFWLAHSWLMLCPETIGMTPKGIPVKCLTSMLTIRSGAAEGVQSRLRYCPACHFQDWSLEILGDGKVGKLFHLAQAEVQKLYRTRRSSPLPNALKNLKKKP